MGPEKRRELVDKLVEAMLECWDVEELYTFVKAVLTEEYVEDMAVLADDLEQYLGEDPVVSSSLPGQRFG